MDDGEDDDVVARCNLVEAAVGVCCDLADILVAEFEDDASDKRCVLFEGGMIMRSRALALSLIAVAISGVCSRSVIGQVPDLRGSDAESLVSEQYTQTRHLPSGIAFAHLIGVLDSVENDVAIRMIVKGFGVSESEASEYLALFLQEKARLDAATAEAQNDYACVNGTPRAYGDAPYPILNGLDDIATVVATDEYLRFQSELNPERASTVRAWIDDRKTSITHIEFDQKVAHKRRGAIGDATLAAFCQYFVAVPTKEKE